ncbi:MAG: shikimate kinase [Proteobacteria bacterium]|nr:shikimate kinase [Pseudomonadota bacterium]
MTKGSRAEENFDGSAVALGDDQRSIVLVGLMGAGKSSIGRRLASELKLPFKDADTEIETASNLSVTEFFEKHGEQAFRDGERKVIARLLDGPRQVLATGGGAFMDKDTQSLIEKKGLSVWLRADLDVIYKRCMKRNSRPLLRNGNPKATLKKLMEDRYPVYGKADITIDSGEGPHEIVVEKIINALSTDANRG